MIVFPIFLIKRVYPLAVNAGVKAIAAGRFHSMVIKTDGTVWAAGRGDDGEHGDGTYTTKTVFKRVLSSGQCGVMV